MIRSIIAFLIVLCKLKKSEINKFITIDFRNSKGILFYIILISIYVEFKLKQ